MANPHLFVVRIGTAPRDPRGVYSASTIVDPHFLRGPCTVVNVPEMIGDGGEVLHEDVTCIAAPLYEDETGKTVLATRRSVNKGKPQ